MSNKFQKSILQRLEQEAVQQKKSVPSERNEESGSEKPTKQTSESKPVSIVGTFDVPDLSQWIEPAPTRQAKNKTFYLDVDVIDAIKAAAKQSGLADSKLVNQILRKILLPQ